MRKTIQMIIKSSILSESKSFPFFVMHSEMIYHVTLYENSKLERWYCKSIRSYKLIPS